MSMADSIRVPYRGRKTKARQKQKGLVVLYFAKHLEPEHKIKNWFDSERINYKAIPSDSYLVQVGGKEFRGLGHMHNAVEYIEKNIKKYRKPHRGFSFHRIWRGRA